MTWIFIFLVLFSSSVSAALYYDVGTYYVKEAGFHVGTDGIQLVLEPAEATFDWHGDCPYTIINSSSNLIRAYYNEGSSEQMILGVALSSIGLDKPVRIHLSSLSNPTCNNPHGIEIRSMMLVSE